MGPLRLAALWLGCAWLGLIAGCAGGQSGTETPSAPPPDVPDGGVTKGGDRHDGPGGAAPPIKADTTQAIAMACACTATSDGTALLRATLQAIDDCTARARVDEVLSPGDARVTAGDVVGGALPGFGGRGQGLDLGVGDDVLVVYTRGTQDGESCTEYAQCLGKKCAGQSDSARDGGVDCFAACTSDTRAACAAHAEDARLGGQLVIARDGNNLVFGYEATDDAMSDSEERDGPLARSRCMRRVVHAARDRRRRLERGRSAELHAVSRARDAHRPASTHCTRPLSDALRPRASDIVRAGAGPALLHLVRGHS